jgi:hypothetical protein
MLLLIQAEDVHTSLVKPPPQLKIEDAPPRTRTTQVSDPQPEHNQHQIEASGVHTQQFVPTVHPPYAHQFGQPGLTPITPYMTPFGGFVVPNNFHAMFGGSQPNNMHSFDTSDDPTIYPRTGDWVRNLDHGNRGIDGQNFSQYAELLEAAGYFRIDQIADESKHESGARDLTTVCQMMPLGIAKLLIKYAVKDCEAKVKDQHKHVMGHASISS